ncbi:MAG: hypothetical protein GF311_21785 [Candidatus Lokiarchaeota archaeon]|nr:hypothetical protein [Candidatus Lokiarchaeota archaeon]
MSILYLSSRIYELEIFYQKGLKVVQSHINKEFNKNPPKIQKNLIAPVKIFFPDFHFSLSFDLEKIDINPSNLELSSELKDLLRAKDYLNHQEIEIFRRIQWEEIDFQENDEIDVLEYKVKELLIKELIYFIAITFNEIIIVENLIDTKYPESTKFIKRCLQEIEILDNYDINNLTNFCNIINKIVNLMHLNDNQGFYLQDNAEKYWEEHKHDYKINMEIDWFQPELFKIFIDTFGSENVSKESELTRGNVDFLVFNLPIDAKCYTDKKDKNKEENPGLELLESEINQVYQYSSHTNLGMMIAFDFRDKESIKDIKIQSVTERIEFKTKGDKLIGKFVFIRRKTPSEIK